MIQPTYTASVAHEVKVLEVVNSIIEHGFGEMTIQVSEAKNMKTRIVILAGKSYVFFIEKEIELKDKDIF